MQLTDFTNRLNDIARSQKIKFVARDEPDGQGLAAGEDIVLQVTGVETEGDVTVVVLKVSDVDEKIFG